MEKWKKHPQFKNYEVSDRGHVRSLPHMVRSKAGSLRLSPGAQLSAVPKADGYVEVAICVKGKRFYRRVNRLVLETFKGPARKRVGRHLDGSRANNELSNLEWGTNKENSQDMIVHGRSLIGNRNPMHTHPRSRSPGEKNGSAKLCAVDVERIRDVRRAGHPYSELVAYFGISKTQIARICTGASW